MAFHGIKFKRIDIQIAVYKKNYEKREKLFINIVFYDFELWILAESVFLLEIFILNKNHSLLDNPLILIQDLNTNFHLEPKNRKPKI